MKYSSEHCYVNVQMLNLCQTSFPQVPRAPKRHVMTPPINCLTENTQPQPPAAGGTGAALSAVQPLPALALPPPFAL